MNIINEKFLKETVFTKGNNLENIKHLINNENIDSFIDTRNSFILEFIIKNYKLDNSKYYKILDFYDLEEKVKKLIHDKLSLEDYFTTGISFPDNYKITKENYFQNRKNFIKHFSKNEYQDQKLKKNIASLFNEEDIQNLQDDEFSIFFEYLINKIEKNKNKVYSLSKKLKFTLDDLKKYPFDFNLEEDKQLFEFAFLNTPSRNVLNNLKFIKDYQKVIDWEKYFKKNNALPSDILTTELSKNLIESYFSILIKDNSYNTIQHIGYNLSENNCNDFLTETNIKNLYNSLIKKSSHFDRNNIDKDSYKMSVEIFIYVKLLNYVTELIKNKDYNDNSFILATNIINTLTSINSYCGSKTCLNSDFNNNNDFISFFIIKYLKELPKLSMDKLLLGLNFEKDSYNSLKLNNVNEIIDIKILCKLTAFYEFSNKDFFIEQMNLYIQENNLLNQYILSQRNFNFNLSDSQTKKEKKKINKLTTKEFIDNANYTVFFDLNSKTVKDLVDNHFYIIELLEAVYKKEDLCLFIIEKTKELPSSLLFDFFGKYQRNEKILDAYFKYNTIDAKKISTMSDTQKNILDCLQKENLLKYVKNSDYLDDLSINEVNEQLKNINIFDIIVEQNLNYIIYESMKDEKKDYDEKSIKSALLEKLNNLIKDNKDPLKIHFLTDSFISSLKSQEKNALSNSKVKLVESTNNFNNLSFEQEDKLMCKLFDEKNYILLMYLLKNNHEDNPLINLNKKISSLTEKEFLNELENPFFVNCLKNLFSGYSYKKENNFIPKLTKPSFDIYFEKITKNYKEDKSFDYSLICRGNYNNSEHIVNYFIENDRKALMTKYDLKPGRGIISHITPMQLARLINLNLTNNNMFFPFGDTNIHINDFLEANFVNNEKNLWTINLNKTEALKIKDSHTKFLKEIKSICPQVYALACCRDIFELPAHHIYEKKEDIKVTREYYTCQYFKDNCDLPTIDFSFNEILKNCLKNIDNNDNDYKYFKYKKNITELIQSIMWAVTYEEEDPNTGHYDIKKTLLSENELKTLFNSLSLNAPRFLIENSNPEINKAFLSNINDLFAENNKDKILNFYENFFYNKISPEYYSMKEKNVDIILKVIDLAVLHNCNTFLEEFIADSKIYKIEPKVLRHNMLCNIDEITSEKLKEKYNSRVESIILKNNLNKELIEEKMTKKRNKI